MTYLAEQQKRNETQSSGWEALGYGCFYTASQLAPGEVSHSCPPLYSLSLKSPSLRVSLNQGDCAYCFSWLRTSTWDGFTFTSQPVDFSHGKGGAIPVFVRTLLTLFTTEGKKDLFSVNLQIILSNYVAILELHHYLTIYCVCLFFTVLLVLRDGDQGLRPLSKATVDCLILPLLFRFNFFVCFLANHL